MSNGRQPGDREDWLQLMSHAGHEIRNPLTPLNGYLRMLFQGTAGPLSDPQRKLLQEIERAATRIWQVTKEMSEVVQIEDGRLKMNTGRVDFGALLDQVIAPLSPMPDRGTTLRLDNQAAGASVIGDPLQLRTALGAVLTAIGRELVTSSELVVRLRRDAVDRRPALRVTAAGGERIEDLDRADPADLAPFIELRGNCGLQPALARRVIEAHQGHVWSPRQEPRSGAVLMLPEGA